MRVGIVSLFGLYNHGNRLQGFAVDQLLVERGFEPTTLVFARKLGLSRAKELVNALLDRLRRSPRAERRREFARFVRPQRVRHLMTPLFGRALRKHFRFFIVGSDQIWHPNADVYRGTKFLQFANPAQRTSLAPSFGVSRLPDAHTAGYQRGLEGFAFVSVREESAAGLVRDQFGLEATVLPDPTFGLTADKWRLHANHERTPSGGYIFCYFLGDPSEGAVRARSEWQSFLGCQVVDISRPTSPDWTGGPQHFLSLVMNATLVLTDSFHASVFSAIFDRPFYVFRRREGQSTFTRIETLLAQLRLENRAGDGASVPASSAKLALPDRTAHLETLRERLNEYLDVVVGYVEDAHT